MARYSNDRAATDVTSTTLAGGYYTDPAYFARETERLFRRMWLFAGRQDDAPLPGSYVTRRLGDASILLLRDDAGTLRAFHNVCRHRGTLLCAGASGQLRGSLQCAYHAWTYRLDGALLKAPHMDKVEGFRVEDWPLVSIPLATWDGHVFVYLGDESAGAEPPPLAEHLDGMDTRFRNWSMGDLRTVATRTYELRANWKLVIANYHECLHCPTAHPQLVKLSHYLSGDNEPPHPTWLGASMDLLPGCATLSTSATPRRAVLPGLSADERRRVYYYALLPTMLLNPHPDYVITFLLSPLAADRTDITCHWLMHPDEMAQPGFDPSDAVDFWDVTNRQDWALSDLAQAGISSRGYRPGPYSNREELLAAFDRWVVERVGPLDAS
ncbi:MAG TPA: aromatic ring-hydroxylating dioxygenase subunit alpha [Vicinamibacterales bacterium]|nr:aromatic ring-hydroxylating dioxygenase subunit alpha [Vicinamibacterales bacterium]